ncbi:MAG TPA: TIGR02587 family membrane protein [Cellvibrio sp.]|nr:TIGR02587 family membrane protein [Cellvibrio sp.]
MARSLNHPAWLGISRAVGGALIFSLPMMMTMEMWEIGFYVEPLRLMILILVSLPLWVGVSSIIGFEETKTLGDDILDVLVAYAIGFITSAFVLLALGIITSETGPGQIFSMLLLQSVPGSLGALLARSLIGSDSQLKFEQGYHQELIILITGSLFLAFNLAPTEEIILISYKMHYWHMFILFLFTLTIMQMFTLSNPDVPSGSLRQWRTHWQLFVRFTSTGYMLAFVVSLFMLWALGRTDGENLGNIINTALVLSFPAGIGASAARLIV